MLGMGTGIEDTVSENDWFFDIFEPEYDEDCE